MGAVGEFCGFSEGSFGGEMPSGSGLPDCTQVTSIDLLGETHVLAMGKGKGHVHLRRTLGHHLYM